MNVAKQDYQDRFTDVHLDAVRKTSQSMRNDTKVARQASTFGEEEQREPRLILNLKQLEIDDNLEYISDSEASPFAKGKPLMTDKKPYDLLV